MTFTFNIRGRTLQTGDVIFTKDGANSVVSLGHRQTGAITFEDADHCILYLGPGGLCVEAGMFGVIKFTTDEEWRSEQMFSERGLLDNFYAAANPFASRRSSMFAECQARLMIRAYALGAVGKPYNYRFENPETEKAFYCSQLVYHAYRQVGIDLNPGQSNGWLARMVLPQTILQHCNVIPTSKCCRAP